MLPGSNQPKGVAFADNYVASASLDGTVHVSAVLSGTEVRVLRASDGISPLWAVAYSRDGQRIAAVADSEITTVWDGNSGQVLQTLNSEPAKWQAGVAFNSDTTRVASAGQDGEVRVWDVGTGAGIWEFKASPTSWRAVAFSPDGALLATGADDGVVDVWTTYARASPRALTD
jgi:WD40 repeat protein